MRGESEKCLKSKLLLSDLNETAVGSKPIKEIDFSIGSLEAFNRIKALDLANEFYPNMIGKKKNLKMLKKVRTAAY